MKQGAINVWLAVRYLFLHAFFWIVTFALHRILFIAINSSKAIDTPIGQLFSALLHGMVFDLSIVGYLSLLYCVIIAIVGQWYNLKKVLSICNYITLALSSVVVFFMPGDGIMYSYWGFHYDATCIAGSTWDAIETWAIVLYLIASFALIAGNYVLLRTLTSRVIDVDAPPAPTFPARITNCVVMLVIAAAMIIPIRGGLDLAPLSNSRAYFSEYQFANHTAMSPLWNFIYSTKRLKEASTTYHFMDDSKAETIFRDLTVESGEYPHLLTTSRPNVIVILLESFSAHAIEFLGGVNATPTIKSLLGQSIVFDHVLAASDRSGKGLVAAMCGYPVLPTISIIQYPKKTQTLPFIARKLRDEGYESQTFIYGGDLNFNNFNSLVNIAGFDNVITEDDFDASMLGPKWGAHDEYAFDRLLEVASSQKQPFFDFFFTLSSHEPFVVPMKRKFDNDYLNSVYYTDMCLGKFLDAARKKSWWKNTVVVLMADHGHNGPDDVPIEHESRFKIPLILTGGAVAKDTLVTKQGSQIDLAKTLLSQMDVDCREFTFSKNLLDPVVKGYSFFDFNDGYGFADDENYQVYDNRGRTWLKKYSSAAEADTLTARAILQIMSDDNQKR
ncbi:MAG: sulfatase-like hydrolase/transferase [Bacteroidales bacterium]|nr:sulfatase-like hydrolase/transferase [Bacteroidales bacterium]